MRHGEHHRSYEDASEAECDQTAHDTGEDEQQGKVGVFLDQNGAQKVIQASDHQGPDEKKCAPSYAVAPLQRSHRWAQHDQGIDCGKRNYDDCEAYTAQAG